MGENTTTTKTVWLSIRPTTYRGEAGFLVQGRGRGRLFNTSIFTWSRDSAEHIKAKVKHGEQTTVEDYW